VRVARWTRPQPPVVAAFSCSSEASALESCGKAFDGDTLSQWSTAAGLYSAAGAYIGGKSTATAAGAVLGEWIQVNYSRAVMPAKITFGAKQGDTGGGLRRGELLGLQASGVWLRIVEFSNVGWTTAELKTLGTYPAAYFTAAYSSFRLIVSETNGASALSVSELHTSALVPGSGWGRNKLVLMHPDGRAFKYDAMFDKICLNSGDAITFNASSALEFYSAAKGHISLKANGTGHYFRHFMDTGAARSASIRLGSSTNNCANTCYDSAWAFILDTTTGRYTIYNDFNLVAGGSYLGYNAARDEVQLVGPTSPLRINNWLVNPALDATLSRTSLPPRPNVTTTPIGALAGSAGMTQLFSGDAVDSALTFTIPFSFKLLNVRRLRPSHTPARAHSARQSTLPLPLTLPPPAASHCTRRRRSMATAPTAASGLALTPI
jgi:hypothetical protein